MVLCQSGHDCIRLAETGKRVFMRALLFSFVLLIAGVLIFAYQDEEVYTLIGGLLFGAMVGSICSFGVGFMRGQAVERWHHTQHHEQRTVASVPTVEA